MKKLRPEVESCIKMSGGITDLFDGLILSLFNITDEEYDFICENASDEEIDKFIGALGYKESVPFRTRRNALEIRNKYVKEYALRRRHTT